MPFTPSRLLNRRRFFCTRVAYGGYRSVLLWRTLDDPRVWPMMRWGFRAACIALNRALTHSLGFMTP